LRVGEFSLAEGSRTWTRYHLLGLFSLDLAGYQLVASSVAAFGYVAVAVT